MGISARIDELTKKFEENPRRYFAPLANEYRKAGQLDQAIAICQQHLAEQPTHMSGHIVFGQALFEAGQFDEAQRVFTAALALDPENLIALRHLGDIARTSGDTAQAGAWYQRVLDADPRNDEIAELVREMAAATPVEGFAGLPTEDAPPAIDPVVAEAPTQEFIPPQLSALDPAPAASEPLPELEPRASVILPASALPAENVVEPLPRTLEIPAVDAQRVIEEAAARRAEAEANTPPAVDAVEVTEISISVSGAVADDLPVYDLSADEPLDPAAVLEAFEPGLPTTDPMDMIDDFGSGAESLLDSGRAAPVDPSPLEQLESQVGDLADPAPLVGGVGATVGDGLDFMDNPLADLIPIGGPTPPPEPSPLDAFSLIDEQGAGLEPEAPLPPPTPMAVMEIADTPDVPLPVRAEEEPTPAPVPAPVADVAPALAEPYVTEAMAEVLERQGLDAQAADVYRQLLAQRPNDTRLAERLDAVTARLAPAGPSVREWFARLASARPRSAAAPLVEAATAPAPTAAVAAEEPPIAAAAPSSMPAAPSGGSDALDALFGPPTNAADEAAARALASLFEAVEPASLPSLTFGASAAASATAATAIAGAPTAPAADELSLSTVFEPPAPPAPAPRSSASFSFDQFFTPTSKTPAAPAPASSDAEMAEFSRWLDGLKKQ
jgi:tetratricopeptide (TPR) repeat protein